MFSLKQLKYDTPVYLNDKLPGEQFITNPWWTFKSPQSKKRQRQTDTPTSLLTVSTFKVTSTSTAILMCIATENFECVNNMFKQSLNEQLKEMHNRKVLHTDLRVSNILAFDFSSLPQSSSRSSTNAGADLSQISHVELCITDFDLAVVCETESEVAQGKSVDVSVPGARTDLILDVLGLKEVDPQNHFIDWSGADDRAMLVTSFNVFKNKCEIKKNNNDNNAANISVARSLHYN